MEWWGYWWLIFPLMGMLGGAAKAWQRGARDRHERRLELLRVKGELKAASARPADPNRREVRATGAGSAAEQAEGSHRAQLEKLFAAQDDVTHRWLDYELDVAKLIAFPAMSDGRQPLTAAFLRAKKVADGLRPDSSTARITREQLTEYRNAVTDYEVAFDVAERDARRIRDSTFSVAERKRLDTAKQLLTVAIDQAATPAERQLAYKRVREELDGLISVSDEAIEVLENKVALELTTGPTTTVADDAVSPAKDAPDAAPPTARSGGPDSPTPVAEPQVARPASPRAGAPDTGAPRVADTAPGRIVRPKN